MMVFTFNDDGSVSAIDNNDAREILDGAFGGESTKRRATHVLPVNRVKRVVFRVIRWATGDGKRLLWLENWTRRWGGPQTVDLTPSNGPVVGPFPDRQAALDWEYQWLADHM